MVMAASQREAALPRGAGMVTHFLRQSTAKQPCLTVEQVEHLEH